MGSKSRSVLEVLSTLLWGAASFGGQDALAGIVSNTSHSSVCQLFAIWRDRTGNPDNHELQKALLEALLKGIFATTAAHIKSLPPPEQTKINAWHKERITKINQLISNLGTTQLRSASNYRWSQLLSGTPEQIALLGHRERRQELRQLKSELESQFKCEELPALFRDSFSLEWLPYVNLYLAESIKTNPRVRQILQVARRNFASVKLEIQLSAQQLTDLFSNPQNFLNSVQVIDFDIQTLRQQMRDLAGQPPGRVVTVQDPLVNRGRGLDAKDPKVDKVLELLDVYAIQKDSNSGTNQLTPAATPTPTIPKTMSDPTLDRHPGSRLVLPWARKLRTEAISGDRPTWKCVQTLNGHSDSVVSIAYGFNPVATSQRKDAEGLSTRGAPLAPSGESSLLVSGSWDKTIKIWHPNLSGQTQGKPLRTLTNHQASVYCVAISPDGQTLASGSVDYTIKLWPLVNSQLLRTLSGHSFPVYSLAISPDSQILASGSGDYSIKLWQVATGELFATLIGHSSFVQSVAFSPDGQTLASGSADKTIKIWQVGTGELLRTLICHSPVNSVAISPDGQTLASGSRDETIKLWQIESGELGPGTRPAPTLTLTGHSGEIFSVAISPDGQLLASGSHDKTIKIWHLQTGNLLCTLTGHWDSVNSVAFSPDGQTLASGSHDRTIKIWRASP